MDNKKKLVTQDNQLIEACYTMTLNEKRLLMLAISKINPMDFPKLSEPLRCKVTTGDWLECFASANAYRDMQIATKAIRQRAIRLHPSIGIEEEINWLEKAVYNKNNSSIELVFTRSIQVRLQGMLEAFTTTDLLHVNKLSSLYSVRLYELLAQYKKTGFRQISIEDFRIAMDCIDKYPETWRLKQKVLAPALRDLKNNNGTEVKVEDVKDGRTIVAFKFTFRKGV